MQFRAAFLAALRTNGFQVCCSFASRASCARSAGVNCVASLARAWISFRADASACSIVGGRSRRVKPRAARCDVLVAVLYFCANEVQTLAHLVDSYVRPWRFCGPLVPIMRWSLELAQNSLRRQIPDASPLRHERTIVHRLLLAHQLAF